MPKKVLIITQNFYPVIGSAGNRMKNIFQLLNEKGIDTDVLTCEPAYPNKNMYKNSEFWDDESLNQESQKIIRVPIKSKRFSNRIISRLFFYVEIMYRFCKRLFSLRTEKYDYILVSTPPIFIVFSAFLGKKLFRSKLILEVRDLWPDSLLGVKAFDQKGIIAFFRLLEKKMYRKADYIVINSEGFRDHIIGKLGGFERPVVYLPNGPREKEVVKSKPVSEDFKVVYAGNLGLAQDIDRLKWIAGQLHKENIQFHVLGYGMKAEEFKDFLVAENLDNVTLHQPATRRKSLELIASCHLSVAFLNEVEVFSTVLPGKIIDYMTCQTPIIAGVKGTAAQTIVNSKVGYVFDSNQIEEMVNKIIELKDKPEQLQQLRENCQRTIEDKFMWENNIDALSTIIT